VDIDPIFPGFRLVGPGKGGAFEPGRLAPEEMKKLPPKAYGITLQLVLWHPFDFRLEWLLAELLNASGQVDLAYEIMDGLRDTPQGGTFRDLMQHRRVLQGPAAIAKQLRKPSKQGHLLAQFMLIPRPTMAPGIAGAAAYQASCTAAEALGYTLEKPPMPGLTSDPENTTPPAQQLPFNWRHILLGFGFGFVVAMLVNFQWQEWKRRRTRQALTEPSAETESALAAPHDSSAAIQSHSTSGRPPGG
jgi:hypothetical protein